MSKENKPRFNESLLIPDIRRFIRAVGCFTLASRALAVVIGFQIYQITRSPFALGMLGLVEAIPAMSLVLFGGHVSDHFDRRRILLITRSASVACSAILAWLSFESGGANSLYGLYGVVFLAGIARGFADPANTAFEAQVVPQPLTVNASSWISSTWVVSSVAGPAAIGFIFDAWGASASYAVIAACFALSWLFTLSIGPKPHPVQETREPVLKSISIGWKYVFSSQALYGAMLLDLFAVLFGGAIALLPVFAEEILHVGAKGLGLLNAAPSLGALVMMLAATHKPPRENAGKNLIWAVGGFGVSILVFAFSTHFWLSMAALFFSGVFDGISMVIRRTMVRLLSPDHLRGRIAAANHIFISASNELGAFESGLLASWIGTVPCVAAGAAATLGIVAFAAAALPGLRTLKFDR